MIALLATPASANPGSALMMVIPHLVLGNLLIGAIESGIAVWLGARWWSLFVLIVANYVSAFIGVTFVRQSFWWIFAALGGEPLTAAVPASWLTLLVLSVAGLVIEAPAFALSFAGAKKRGAGRMLGALLIANVLTNALLAVYYASVWKTSLVDDLRVVADAREVVRDAGVGTTWVYTIGQDQRSIWRVRLDGTGEEQVRTLERAVARGRLAVREASDGVRRLCIVTSGAEPIGLERVRDEVFDLDQEREDEAWWERTYEVVVLPANVTCTRFKNDEFDADSGPTSGYGDAADLREGDVPFSAKFSWDGVRGITLTYPDHEQRLALDNPVIERHMTPFSVSVLPEDVLVFELTYEFEASPWGTYVASLETGRIARLTTGRSPVVVIEPGDVESGTHP